MMKKLTLISALACILLSACSTAATPTLDATSPAPSDYSPSPADSALTRGPAFLDDVELLTLESFPLQFSLLLKGNLPDPCHQLRISVSPPNANNEILVDVYSVAAEGKMCAQVLSPFEASYPLGSFPSGHYILLVNGTQEAEFDA
ncbi:MAG: hypothetical protein IT310_06965 [Anaerolineales bacterium]|nr:hypothetical protein [Anaerolineales bacterium]